ncbi:substrate-binding periplasmic protein [Roseateles violae]|uniref:Transporter substrate-binding domain-containing protein n=1 Tax=Roseateles violae TaxID=3058042 RepID=A0ABT8DZC9_9BURK|nr:transporter substrate-binding domain-containing protein [Pelomonas sp. PFR6]MDN3922952.1 transporter substrate-binding domain-containing protein [Pelomonas sp. PFR6]
MSTTRPRDRGCEQPTCRRAAAACRWTLALLLAAALRPEGALAAGGGHPDEAPLKLYFYERPPFHYSDAQGRVIGSTAASTEELLRRAELRVQWVPLPANRILNSLRSEQAPACSPGWYATPERRAEFWFSQPTMRDKPLIALLRADFDVPAGITAKAFFEQAQLRLLVKQNFSQGAYMNALIARMPESRVQRVALEVPGMVQMLKAKRADAIITTEAEAELFVQAAGLSMRDFRIVRFPDVPADEYRYIVCSRQVDAQLLARIDKAIAASKP